MPKFSPTALSLFSGIGGFCEGVRKAGFTIVGAVEKDQYAAANYRANFPKVPLFEGDIESFLPLDQKKERLAQHQMFCGGREIDLLFGGPPCQGFSSIGPRKIADPRNGLFLQMCRIAKILSPKFVLMENVPNMFRMGEGYFKDLLFSSLRQVGYPNIAWNILNAADYGVPQERRRVFIIATKEQIPGYDIQDVFDRMTRLLVRPPATVDDAISDLPEVVAPDSGCTVEYPRPTELNSFLKEMRLDSSGKIFKRTEKNAQYFLSARLIELHNHHTKEIQARRLKLVRLLKQGKKADSLPARVWNNARPEKWRRFDPSRPAHTLMAQMHRDLSEWVHPHFDRWITVREALRLQAFHDGFVLGGSEWQQLKQVGNAVPPLLGLVPATVVNILLTCAKGQSRKLPHARINEKIVSEA